MDSLTSDTDSYIPRFGWVRDGILWAQVMNRAQDTIDLYFIEAKSGRSRKVLTETSPDAWVNVNDDFHVLKSGDRFIWSSWRDGDTHLYLYSFRPAEPAFGGRETRTATGERNYEVLASRPWTVTRLLHSESG